ncbi:MAG: ribosome silencing factor [Candidatus Omnitrophota bacterium]
MVIKKNSESKVKALKIAEFVLDKQAKRPVVLNLEKLSTLCDYFVICSVDTGVQAEAVCDWVVEKSKELNYKVHHSERDDASGWVLVDFFDVILHIFVDDLRKFYDLEHLWIDAKKVRIPKKQKTEVR